jgi:SPOR domain
LQRCPHEGKPAGQGQVSRADVEQSAAIAGRTLLEKRAMSSEKPDQIQASVAAALSRLRGDLGPSGATAPKIDEPPMGERGAERARPANDVRGDPFFRSIHSPPPGTGMAGRTPIPMTPFPRMQASQEPATPDAPMDDEAGLAPEPDATIEIPEMPERASLPDPVLMPEPSDMASEPTPPSMTAGAAPRLSATPAAGLQSQSAPTSNSPLSRMMRGPGQPGSTDSAQRDLLAGLPPPPISEPLTGDTEADLGAMRRRRRNRRLLAMAAVIVVVAIGAWLWTGSEPSTEVPVITGEATPEKVKPAEEGGLQVQNQDVQVLDPSTQTQGENVMPEPEQPMTPPAPSGTASSEQAPTIVENTAPEASSAATSEAPAAEAPPAPLSTTPLPDMDEDTTAKTDAAPAAPVVPAPQPAQTAEAPAASEPAPTTAEPAPAPAPAPAATQPEPAQAAQPEPPAAQEAPTQEAAVTPAAPTGNIRVQLAAGKSEASVQKEWAALQKAYPALLGGLGLTIERVDKGAAGVFYRLQAGPLADKAAAKELCASLKQKNQDCLVVAK